MVVLTDAGPVRSLLDPAISVRALGSPDFGRWKRLLAAVSLLARYLRERSPAIFHSPGNHTHFAAFMAVRRAGFAGAYVPKITNPLFRDSMPFARRLWRRWLYSRVLAAARCTLVLSPESARTIGELFPACAGQLVVVHNPYLSEAMLADTLRQRQPASPPVILAAGRLSRQKDYATLLRAVARLRDRPWKLRICGTGPDEAKLRQLVCDLGIAERVEFAGFVGDMVREYRAASVLAMSSRWEGLPATLLEAMACGCPVVSTASSPGVVNLLRALEAEPPVAVADAAGLAVAIARGLEGRLPVISRDLIARYGIEAACEEHAAVFAALMAR
jgi:glycosyltransferase involved in cell wall biosynthesis